MTNSPNSTQAGPPAKAPAQIRQITMKELALLMIAIFFTAGLVGGYWVYVQQKESYAKGTTTIDLSKDLTPANPQPVIGGQNQVALPVLTAASPVTFKTTDSMHADIYFDFDRSRLRADAVAILQEKAEVLKGDNNWAVLVQGYADQHGPAEYNRTLASRRAGAVKQFLVELGIPDTSIKVVTLGQEGSICDDQSKECQRHNRRVHLEMMKLGVRESALVPASSTFVTQQEKEGDSALTKDQDLTEHDEKSVSGEPEASSETR
jgi:peptidoglycan-associated lipoprotein